MAMADLPTLAITAAVGCAVAFVVIKLTSASKAAGELAAGP
jgi:hypothetical protein